MNKSRQEELIKASGPWNLKRIGLSNTAILIIGRMEYWFRQYPDGFYKHGKECEDQFNLPGFAWETELGISKSTFKKYFLEVGLIHNSLEEYRRAKWKFEGKFYCCVLEESNNHRTKYYRNHNLAAIIDGVLAIDYSSDSNEFNMGLKA